MSLANSTVTAGRVVLLTGSAGGIGQSFARRLARDGYAIVLADRAPSDELADELRFGGANALAVTVELSQPASIDALCDEALSWRGRVDGLVNNAAFMAPCAFEDLSLDGLRHYFQVNVEAPFLLAKQLLPGMCERGFGRIVNIVSGSPWGPPPGFTGYVSTKMAMMGMTRTLAVEYGRHGITVNAMTPGATRHAGNSAALPDAVFQAAVQRQAIPRPAEPDDAAGMLSFLLSNDAAFVTGQTMVADGGKLFLP